MDNIIIMSKYLKNDVLRKSFNELAIKTFNLNFEPWYKSNVFCNRYIPYSYVINDKVVANISINKFQLMIDGLPHRALQIGTVMTDLEYRNKGLSKKLMEYILKEYEEKYDLIYLFSNSSALDFYPKFGFERVDENIYEINANDIKIKDVKTRLLDISSKQDELTLYNIVRNRQPISNAHGVYRDKWPLLITSLKDTWDRYFIVDDEIVVLAKREDGILHIYDILSRTAVDLDNALEKMVSEDDVKVVLHFVAKSRKYSIKSSVIKNDDDALFIHSKEKINCELSFPLTSHT